MRDIDNVYFAFTGFDEISLLYYKSKELREGRKLTDKEFFALYDFFTHNKSVKERIKRIYEEN